MEGECKVRNLQIEDIVCEGRHQAVTPSEWDFDFYDESYTPRAEVFNEDFDVADNWPTARKRGQPSPQH